MSVKLGAVARPHVPAVIGAILASRRSFDTKDGEWQDITLPFSEFIATFRARTLRDGSKLNPASVCSVQLMLSKFEYDGELNPNFKSGPMQLPIESVRAYLKEPVTPRCSRPAGQNAFNLRAACVFE